MVLSAWSFGEDHVVRVGMFDIGNPQVREIKNVAE